MLKLMNLRPDEVDGTDPWTGEPFVCAAHPGTMEVSEKLGRNLAQQEDNWQIVDDTKAAKATKKGEG